MDQNARLLHALLLTLSLSAAARGSDDAGLGAPADHAPASATDSQVPRPFLEKHCTECHNRGTGKLPLDRLIERDVWRHRNEWEKVARRLRDRTMPPEYMPRPDDRAYEAALASIEGALAVSAAPAFGSLPLFLTVVFVVAFLAGSVAAATGFGVGSLLTPLLALPAGIRLAVALVSLPHVSATALRLYRLRAHVDRTVLLHFGLLSAAGGLVGALLEGRLPAWVLTAVLGTLLCFAGLMGLTGLSDRLRFGNRTAWLAGLVSGALGGLVGNQGGLRSAALLGFNLRKEAFIATATATALIVDGARTPIYLFRQWRDMLEHWPLIVVATAGVLVGTLAGDRLLRRIPDAIFRRVVAAALLLLGILVFFIRD